MKYDRATLFFDKTFQHGHVASAGTVGESGSSLSGGTQDTCMATRRRASATRSSPRPGVGALVYLVGEPTAPVDFSTVLCLRNECCVDVLLPCERWPETSTYYVSYL